MKDSDRGVLFEKGEVFRARRIADDEFFIKSCIGGFADVVSHGACGPGLWESVDGADNYLAVACPKRLRLYPKTSRDTDTLVEVLEDSNANGWVKLRNEPIETITSIDHMVDGKVYSARYVEEHEVLSRETDYIDAPRWTRVNGSHGSQVAKYTSDFIRLGPGPLCVSQSESGKITVHEFGLKSPKVLKREAKATKAQAEASLDVATPATATAEISSTKAEKSKLDLSVKVGDVFRATNHDQRVAKGQSITVTSVADVANNIYGRIRTGHRELRLTDMSGMKLLLAYGGYERVLPTDAEGDAIGTKTAEVEITPTKAVPTDLRIGDRVKLHADGWAQPRGTIYTITRLHADRVEGSCSTSSWTSICTRSGAIDYLKRGVLEYLDNVNDVPEVKQADTAQAPAESPPAEMLVAVTESMETREFKVGDSFKLLAHSWIAHNHGAVFMVTNVAQDGSTGVSSDWLTCSAASGAPAFFTSKKLNQFLQKGVIEMVESVSTTAPTPKLELQVGDVLRIETNDFDDWSMGTLLTVETVVDPTTGGTLACTVFRANRGKNKAVLAHSAIERWLKSGVFRIESLVATDGTRMSPNLVMPAPTTESASKLELKMGDVLRVETHTMPGCAYGSLLTIKNLDNVGLGTGTHYFEFTYERYGTLIDGSGGIRTDTLWMPHDTLAERLVKGELKLHRVATVAPVTKLPATVELDKDDAAVNMAVANLKVGDVLHLVEDIETAANYKRGISFTIEKIENELMTKRSDGLGVSYFPSARLAVLIKEGKMVVVDPNMVNVGDQLRITGADWIASPGTLFEVTDVRDDSIKGFRGEKELGFSLAKHNLASYLGKGELEYIPARLVQAESTAPLRVDAGIATWPGEASATNSTISDLERELDRIKAIQDSYELVLKGALKKLADQQSPKTTSSDYAVGAALSGAMFARQAARRAGGIRIDHKHGVTSTSENALTTNNSTVSQGEKMSSSVTTPAFTSALANSEAPSPFAPVVHILAGVTGTVSIEMFVQVLSRKLARAAVKAGRHDLARMLVSKDTRDFAKFATPAMLLGVAVVGAKMEHEGFRTACQMAIPHLESATTQGLATISIDLIKKFVFDETDELEEIEALIAGSTELANLRAAQLAAAAAVVKTM